MANDGTAFKHVAAESITEKKKAEKLRQKIEERRNKRDIEKKLGKVKGLGESDSDGDDTSAWIAKSRKLEKKKVRSFNFFEEKIFHKRFYVISHINFVTSFLCLFKETLYDVMIMKFSKKSNYDVKLLYHLYH